MRLAQFLSLGGLASVSASGRALEDPPVLGFECITTSLMTGGDMAACCPCALPDHGICAMLWCIDLDTLTMKDGCSCNQISTACDQVGEGGLNLLAMVDGLEATCDQVKTCCPAETEGEAFNGCMTKALEDGTVMVPDLSLLETAGGLPTFEGDPNCPAPEATAVTADVVPPPEGPLPVVAAPGNHTDHEEGGDHDEHEEGDHAAGNATAHEEEGHDDHEGHDHGETEDTAEDTDAADPAGAEDGTNAGSRAPAAIAATIGFALATALA